MKKAIIALALVCTPMVWAHGPGHYRPGENPHDPRHRAAAHNARPVPPPARPQAPGVRPPAPGPQRPAPGVQRPQPPRPQAPAVHRPAPQGHPAPPPVRGQRVPTMDDGPGPGGKLPSPSPDKSQMEPGFSGSGNPPASRPSRHQIYYSDSQNPWYPGASKEGPIQAEPGLEGTGAVQKGTGRSPRKPINSSSFGTR